MKSIQFLVKQLFIRTEYHAEYVSFLVAMMSGFGFIVYMWSQPWAYRRTGDGLGIAIFPSVFVSGIIVFSLICLIDTHKKAKNMGTTPVEGGKVTDTDMYVKNVEWGVTVFLSVVTIAASCAIDYVDPLILTATLGVVILIAGGVRQWYLLVGTAVGLSLFIYFFIVRLAGIYFKTSWFF